MSVLIDSQTHFDDVPQPPPAGLWVEVEGILVAPDTVLASELSIPIGLTASLVELSIEGFVSDFQGFSSFRVDGQLVDASLASFEPSDASFLESGILVEVEGPLRNGVLQALEVRLEEPAFKIAADLASTSDVDPAQGTLVLAGVELRLERDANLRYEAQGSGSLRLDDLTAGDSLEVRGSVSGGIRWVDRLQRVEATERASLRGPVTAVDTQSQLFEVLGVQVPTGPQTGFFDPVGLRVTAAEFVGALQPGSMISAADGSGSDSTRIVLADVVELED